MHLPQYAGRIGACGMASGEVVLALGVGWQFVAGCQLASAIADGAPRGFGTNMAGRWFGAERFDAAAVEAAHVLSTQQREVSSESGCLWTMRTNGCGGDAVRHKLWRKWDSRCWGIEGSETNSFPFESIIAGRFRQGWRLHFKRCSELVESPGTYN